MISIRKGLIALIVLIASAGTAAAQFQGKISGHVRDAAGNPVEKAEVSIISQKTSTVRYELKTDREGRFVQVGLLPGYFMINVKKTGFAPGSTEIKVGVAGEETVQITLKTAGVAPEHEKAGIARQLLEFLNKK